MYLYFKDHRKNCPAAVLFYIFFQLYNLLMGILDQYKVIDIFSDDHFLVRNEVSGALCYLKILTHYEIPVYEYLRTHSDPHVVKIHDYAEIEGKLYVYEEYLTGETMHDLLLKGVLTEEKKKDMILQICDGLKFLHSAFSPIIHRDLKPENIIVTSEGKVKIIDYDIAKFYKSGKDRDTTLLGSFDYAAPEQYGFSQSDPRTDIFALGKIIEQISSDPAMLKVAGKATQIDPDNRYKSIDDMKYDILHPKKELWPPPGFRRKKPLHMIVAIFYLLTAAFFIIGVQVTNADWSLGKRIFYLVELLIFFFLHADIFGSWTGLFDKIPFRKKNKVTYIIIGIILSVLAIVLVRVINQAVGGLGVFDR